MQINQILYKRLQAAGLVEQVQGESSARPAWRLKDAAESLQAESKSSTAGIQDNGSTAQSAAETDSAASSAAVVSGVAASSDDSMVTVHDQRPATMITAASAGSSCSSHSPAAASSSSNSDSTSSSIALWAANRLTVAFSNLQDTAAQLTKDALQHRRRHHILPGSSLSIDTQLDAAATVEDPALMPAAVGQSLEMP